MKEGKLYSLEALTNDPLATRNTVLFACLTALGIPPEVELCGEFVETVRGENRSVTVWRLREQSMCGRFKTAAMIKLFHDPEFVTRDPEHPLAYLKAAFDNHSRAIEFVKDQGPIAVRRRGKKIGFITKRTSPEYRKRILDELNAAA